MTASTVPGSVRDGQPIAGRVRIGPCGSALYVRPQNHGGGGKRDVIRGFSRSAARRHTRFLQSIEVDLLDGDGWAFTLTVRDNPADHLEWKRALDAWQHAAARAGRLRTHWVQEDQGRKVPHLHIGLYFPEGTPRSTAEGLVHDWLRITAKWRSRRVGQHVERIAGGGEGWAKYCAKHAGRSATHAQRGSMPTGWERSGRLWGYSGDWPRAEHQVVFDHGTWVQLRRLWRSWRKADATRALWAAQRAVDGARTPEGHRTAAHHLAVAQRRAAWVRRQDRRPGRLGSAVSGMREWIPRSTVDAMVAAALELNQTGWAAWPDRPLGNVGAPDSVGQEGT